MKFKIGDKVGFLNQKGSATILKIISDKVVCIVDENGFEMQYPVNQLNKIIENIKIDELKVVFKDEKVKKATDYSIISDKKNNNNFWELDLHIDMIIKDYKHLTSFEILNIQFRKMKEFLHLAKNKQIRKVIIIHGVGEGVLKNEIRTYLHNFPELYSYHDASYLEYGKGATEVLIF